METWTLRDRGRELAVGSRRDGGRTHVHLHVDGVEVAAGCGTALDTVKLAHDYLRVRAALGWRGRLRSVDLVDHGDDGPPTNAKGGGFEAGRLSAQRVPFRPPAGSAAARRYAWRQAHPTLWAARHVLVEVLGVAAAVLGVGAVVSGFARSLLPRLDLGWLPGLDPPDWLRRLDPGYWIGRILPDVTLDRLLGWMPDLPSWTRYVVVVAIAVAAALHEVRKHRRREERERSRDGDEGSLSR